jgi:hypothetical protein
VLLPVIARSRGSGQGRDRLAGRGVQGEKDARAGRFLARAAADGSIGPTEERRLSRPPQLA